MIRLVAFLSVAAAAGVLTFRVWQKDVRGKKGALSLDELRMTAQSSGEDTSASNIQDSAFPERVKYQGDTFDTCTVDLTSAPLKCYFRDDDGRRLGSLLKLKQYLESKSSNLIFATNAGMYSPNGNSVGLLIAGGKRMSHVDLKSGTGNFYLKPNGVFLVSRGRALITESSKFEDPADVGSVAIATQSGPLLVLDGVIHPAFQQNSENRCIRSGVGLISPTKVVFAISDGPVNFYEFGLLFKERFKCSDALYLDGVVSRMFLPALKRYDSDGDFAGLIGIAK
jgi:uncharacterized protein YigE (DUF2233 family)